MTLTRCVSNIKLLGGPFDDVVAVTVAASSHRRRGFIETNRWTWFVPFQGIFPFVETIYVRDGPGLAAYPSGNNISAALQIPLCRRYGLTEVDYRGWLSALTQRSRS
ncbi:uncharacterized protein LOC143145233 isoform X3 [Ptiloglossa arizonensis]|uniref:uncharacterized protein LOC143145233 isoform X3 n=1 Tax=Ptiloglossa arizonensis TaxID=3350558 RepID=UPI003F9EBB4B